MKHSLPWESVPPPIYPAQSSLKPRKKWVQTGGWILVVVLLLFGISTRSRNPLLAFVSLAFSVLYLLTLMTKKDAALTSRGLEIYYDMQFTTNYEFYPWEDINAIVCEDRGHATARITAWLEKQVNHYHEYMTREVNGYSRVISDAVEYICRSFRNPDLSLNDVAAYVHLSPGYLSGEFKRETGVTLKSYLTDIRIEAAKKMMEDGNYKIYEICSAVGYNSSQYFSQAFYKKTGMFPTEYSKKGGRKNEK